MSTHPGRHGLIGNTAATRRQIQQDEAAFRAADEQAQQEWTRRRALKMKQTEAGPVNKPPTTEKVQSNLEALAELLGVAVDSIREAQDRERVLDSAEQLDRGRFPSVGGAR